MSTLPALQAVGIQGPASIAVFGLNRRMHSPFRLTVPKSRLHRYHLCPPGLGLDIHIEATRAADRATVLVRLYDPNGRVVASGTTNGPICPGSNNLFRIELQIDTPALWSIDTPSLYQAEITVGVNKQISDICYFPFGIRSLRIDAVNGLQLKRCLPEVKRRMRSPYEWLFRFCRNRSS